MGNRSDGRTTRPDLSVVLGGLKDFQRETVDYVFDRLYGDGNDAVRRFLVADEVGLGKTLVARGVIARAIDHLWDSVERIDVVYVCSNQDIARQNVNRLSCGLLEAGEEVVRASRLTLLPKTAAHLGRNKVNFVTLTPATSFDLVSSLGTVEERALLFRMLEASWQLRGAAPMNVLRGNADLDVFRRWVEWSRAADLDQETAEAFVRSLVGAAAFRERFDALCPYFSTRKRRVSQEVRMARARLVGELRRELARTCLAKLQPDLIILDEFQRFPSLLATDSEAGALAHELFSYADAHSKARVLLLSATPYRMYTRAEESDDHFRDFLRTLEFLMGGPGCADDVQALFARLRQDLLRLDGRGAVKRLTETTHQIEAKLKQVIARTDRIAGTADRLGMLKCVEGEASCLHDEDLRVYVAIHRVARRLGLGHTGALLEYWKAAPYLLNFMEGYELKEAFTKGVARLSPADQAAMALDLSAAPGALLPVRSLDRYEPIDPGNARLRRLIDDTVQQGTWKLLWLPPCLPYYGLAGPFEGHAGGSVTKRLVFSAWQVVPRAVAALVSYDAERRIMKQFDSEATNTPAARERLPRLLRFSHSEDRSPGTRGLTGMATFALMYPSVVLARIGDPLAVARGSARRPSLKTVLQKVGRQIQELLEQLDQSGDTKGPADENWYWAAPLLLDRRAEPRLAAEWLAQSELPALWRRREWPDDQAADSSAWNAHVSLARDIVADPTAMGLGRRPRDLARVLAELAVGAPGVVALRALGRVSGLAAETTVVRNAAATVGWSFRSLLNLPESVALIRGMSRDEPYWQRALEYCLDGCLQAVLDEFAHVLKESQGLGAASPAAVAVGVAEAMCDALTLRTSSLKVDHYAMRSENGQIVHSEITLRCRFALPFGDQRSEQDERVARSEQVRAAFNSPFWPFVLVTTSIGQEGLDFHSYCHAVVHWDLPSNPVDMEQREGRVHRYKGHAVRKNVAGKYGVSRAFPGDGEVRQVWEDPWEILFERARDDRPRSANDLVPYWIYHSDGAAGIERHVYAYPLSRDKGRLEELRSAMVLYRMVLGQPHQEDLLAWLMEHPGAEDTLRGLGVDLSPGRGTHGR